MVLRQAVLERALDGCTEGVEAIERERLRRGELPRGRRVCAVVGEEAVQEREQLVLVDAAGVALDDPRAELEVTEQPALLTQADLRAVGELLGAAEVVDDRRGDEDVAVEARVELARLECERRDRDGVLEQPAEVAVVPVARARRAPQRRTQLR